MTASCREMLFVFFVAQAQQHISPLGFASVEMTIFLYRSVLI
jgi:hypothetical protein